MNIGIDVDAVLLDWKKGLLAMAEIFDIDRCRGNGKIKIHILFKNNTIGPKKKRKNLLKNIF